jgi:putative protease
VVTAVESDCVRIEPGPAQKIAALKPGDGIVFDAADWRSPEENEEGGRIFEARVHLSGEIELRFANQAIRFDRIRAGDIVWRTHDPAIDRAAREFIEPASPVARQTVNVAVTARAGAPLHAVWSLAKEPDTRVTIESSHVLVTAQNRSVSLDTLCDQFGRLGNTPYELGELTLQSDEPVFAPASVLNHMRRDAVERLQAAQTGVKPREIRHASIPAKVPAPARSESTPQLHVLVRTKEQLEAALEIKPASITLDYLDFFGLRPSIERVKTAGIPVRVASPRVLKPGEARILNFLVSLDCPMVVRSAGLIHALRDQSHAPLIADFSLNIASSITAEMFIELGVSRITPTHDLNAAQVADLAKRMGGGIIEAIAYQHLPVFHTEHCVFCRFLSKGTSHRDCGRPCEKHAIALKDAKGRAHPVLADVGCRNTVFGAEAQEASVHMDAWRAAGIHHFRLEFVDESGSQLRRVYQAFNHMLEGVITPHDLPARLRAIVPRGTTEGSLFVPADYLKLPVLQ